MRVTPRMVMDTTLWNMDTNFARLEELQSQITSGSRLRQPSDDPIGVGRAMNLQQGIEQTKQLIQNIDQANAWLGTTDSTLNGVGSVLQRARDLAVQGASDSLNAQDRQQILSEIQQLEDQAYALSNAKYGAYYIFAGSNTNNPAYQRAGSAWPYSYTYQGNAQLADDQVTREVSPGIRVGINVRGSDVFASVFTALANLETGLSTSSSADIRSSIGDVDSALDAVLNARAQVGAKMNRLDFLNGTLQSSQIGLTQLLSNVKDADMAEAMTNFSIAQVVYQASLKASGQALQPSLLDYLR